MTTTSFYKSIFILLFSLSLALPAVAEVISDAELLQLQEVLSDEEINKLIALLESEAGEITLLLSEVLETSSSVEQVIRIVLEKRPEYLSSVIAAAANLDSETIEKVIQTSKEVLPNQENEIIVLALSEGIEPGLITEATSAGNVSDDSTSPVITVNEETELTDSALDLNQPVLTDVNPVLDGGGVASPN